MFVHQWMSSPAVALAHDTPAVDAVEIMQVRRIRRLPILWEGRLAGIVTLGDLQAVLGPNENSSRRAQTLLGDLMHASVHTVAPDAPLERAARLMLQHDISGLPVVERGEILGVITESDIFRAFTRIMGIWEVGGRVVLEIPRGSDLLEEIRSATDNAPLHSLAAYRSTGGGWEVVARLRTTPVRAR